jgi:lysophospholipase L1-like esterase
LEEEYKSEDHLHLSNLGYTFIAAYLKDFLLEVKNY